MAHHDFETRIRETIVRYGMLCDGERVLAAVSGGADSMALMEVLHRLGYAVEVAHLDHQTREGGSAADAAFVRDAAEALGLRFHMECRPIGREAAALGLSFEMHARNARYAFFARIAKAHQCGAVATGHHQGDQGETLLMRLLRGAGPSGMAGIPPVRLANDIRMVRPLLEVSKEDIESWLRGQGVSWCEDSSNAVPDFFRNRIRHSLLPQLRREYNPAIGQALARLAESLRVEDGLLDTLTEDALAGALSEDGQCLDRGQFARWHEAIRRRAVLAWGWRHGIGMPHARVAAASRFVLEGAVGHRFPLGGGIELYNGRTHTEIVEPQETNERKAPVRLAIPGSTVAFGRRFECRFLERLPEESLKTYARPWRQVVDADTLGDNAIVRTRKAGDRIHPLGMIGSKAVKEYYKEVGLPAPRRAAHPLIEAKGRIVWIVGYAISADAAVASATRRWLIIEVSPEG